LICNKPLVHIIVLNWNAWEDTLKCLESIIKQDYLNYRVILCDNNSSDNSIEKIISWANINIQKNVCNLVRFSNDKFEDTIYTKAAIDDKVANDDFLLSVVNTGDNLGFTGGNNVGIELAVRANTDYIWILNNDTVVSNTCLSEMIAIAESSPQIGITGSKIYFEYPSKEIWFAGSTYSSLYVKSKTLDVGVVDDDINWETTIEAGFITGCSMLIPKKIINEVGTFDDQFFFGMEDLDLSLRVKEAGYKCVVARKAKVWHKASSSTGGVDSPIYLYYFTRNRLILMRKNFSLYNFPMFFSHYIASSILKPIIFALIMRKPMKIYLSFYYAVEDFMIGKYGKADSSREEQINKLR
jgi:GT2 family glycosyltransferase